MIYGDIQQNQLSIAVINLIKTDNGFFGNCKDLILLRVTTFTGR